MLRAGSRARHHERDADADQAALQAGECTAILLRKQSQTAHNLALMLDYGPVLGLRPCEFFGLRLVQRTLFIVSAKYSLENGRGLAEERVITLTEEFSQNDLLELGDLIAGLNEQLAAAGGDRAKLVKRYGAMLRGVRARVSSARLVTLKTTRHQFRANMSRAGYSRAEVSAAMGHLVTDTSGNYGRTNKGWRSYPGYRPIEIPAELVARVRLGARSAARITYGYSRNRQGFAP